MAGSSWVDSMGGIDWLSCISIGRGGGRGTETFVSERLGLEGLEIGFDRELAPSRRESTRGEGLESEDFGSEGARGFFF